MRLLCLALVLLSLCSVALATDAPGPATLYYQGHASLRVTVDTGEVIYIDPYAGDGYDLPADLILVTHGHSDHNQVNKIETRNPDCRIITHREALLDGAYQTFDLGYVQITAVEAGNNRNHSLKSCVGYVLTFSNGIKLYVSGDTSTTEQMAELADWQIDYAFFCCDGTYNMGPEEALACAKLMAAKHTIPYHYGESASQLDEAALDAYALDGLMILHTGKELTLE